MNLKLFYFYVKGLCFQKTNPRVTFTVTAASSISSTLLQPQLSCTMETKTVNTEYTDTVQTSEIELARAAGMAVNVC